MRDHGATYVIDGKGNKKVIDFGWTVNRAKDWLETYYEGDEGIVEK